MVGVQTVAAAPAPGFELSVVDLDPERASVGAVGEFDLAAKDSLASLLRQLETRQRRVVRVDLSDLTLIDCSCLGVLVASHHRLLALHGLLVLTGIGARTARILQITGLDTTLFVVVGDRGRFGSAAMAQPA